MSSQGSVIVAHQHDRAIQQQRFAIELYPKYTGAYVALVQSYLYKGLHDDAISAAEKALEISAHSSFFMYPLGVSYACAGRTSEARQLLEKMKDLSRTTYVSSSALGILHLALGELDQGFERLMRAVEERELFVAYVLKNAPFFDPFRSDLRYQALLHKMNLKP